MSIYGKGLKIADNLDKLDYDISQYKYLNAMLNSNVFVGDKRVLVDSVYRSEKEKLEFLNIMTNGDAEYLINLLKDFEEAKINGDIKKNSSFGYNTNSISAWIKKNDTKEIMSIDYNGNVYYYAFGIKSVDTARFRTEYGRINKELIDGLYEALQDELIKTEEHHFRENNEDQKLITELRRYYHNSNIILDFGDKHDYILDKYFHKNGIETRMKLDMNIVKDLLNLYRETEQNMKQIVDKANEQLKQILK